MSVFGCVTKRERNVIKGKILSPTASSRATCRNCDGDDCTNNILEDIKQEKILTSGYFGSSKPVGKCPASAYHKNCN